LPQGTPTAADGAEVAARWREGAGSEPSSRAGHFQAVDEVVCEALRLLHEREELFASGLLVAERVYSNLLHAFDLLADMPEMGHNRPDDRRNPDPRRTNESFVPWA
jgi:hypothetical protein